MGNLFSSEKIEVDKKFEHIDISDASHPFGFDKKYQCQRKNIVSQNPRPAEVIEVSTVYSGPQFIIRCGRTKRRRSESTPNELGPDYCDFRKDVLGIFNGSNMNNALNFFFTSVDAKDHKCVIQDEVVFCYEFHYMSSSQRVDALQTHFTEDHQNLLLCHLLGQINVDILRQIVIAHFPGQKDVSEKNIIVQQILTRYFRRSKEFQTRVEEAKNISSVSHNSFRFLEICGVLIPLDVILHILSFCQYDSTLLLETGRVCKSMYLSILRSWPSIRLNRTNIYQVSLLVLNSVKSVSIEVLDPTQKLQNYDVEHIISHLNPNRLQTIEIHSNLDWFAGFLRYICFREKKEHFPHVRTLNFSICNGDPKKDRATFRCNTWDQISISTVFPNLQKFSRPVRLVLLRNLRVQRLVLDLSIRRRFGNIVYFFQNPFSQDPVKRNVEELEVVVEHSDDSGIKSLPELLIGFENLKTLKVTMICECNGQGCSRASWGVGIYSFIHLPKTSKIILNNEVRCVLRSHRVFLFPPQSPSKDEFPNLRVLEFTSMIEKHGISSVEAGWCLQLAKVKDLKFSVFFRRVLEFDAFLRVFERYAEKFDCLRLTFLITPLRFFFAPIAFTPYPKCEVLQSLSFYSRKGSNAIWIELKNSVVQHQDGNIRNHVYIKKLLVSLTNLLNGMVRKKKWVVFYHHELARNVILSKTNTDYMKNNRYVVNSLVQKKLKADAGYELAKVDEGTFYYICEDELSEN